MRKVTPRMGVLGATCAILARSWLQVGRFWEVLGSILESFLDIGGSVKSNNTIAFWLYFWYFGGSWRRCFSMLCGDGAKRGKKSKIFGQVGDLGGHFGAKRGPKIFPRRAWNPKMASGLVGPARPAAEAWPMRGGGEINLSRDGL